MLILGALLLPLLCRGGGELNPQESWIPITSNSQFFDFPLTDWILQIRTFHREGSKFNLNIEGSLYNTITEVGYNTLG